MLSEKQKKISYLFSIILLFSGLFFSPFLISLSQFIILGIWIFEGNYSNKFLKLKQDKPALVFLSFYVFFLIGLLWTKDFQYALHDLKIKLPLFAIPFLLTTSLKITKKDLNILLSVFILFAFVKIFQSSIVLIRYNFSPTIEQLTCGISHIRYSLMLVFAVFSIFYLFKQDNYTLGIKILAIVIILIFSYFIFILQSLTAIIIYIILLCFYALYIFFKFKSFVLRISGILLILLISVIGILSLNSKIKLFIHPKDSNEYLVKYTPNGNPYNNDTSNIFIENGYHVGYYQCDKELEKEWNLRSKIKYNSKDKNGYPIRFTLKRYLTSKGLRKDSAGIWALSDEDIKNIENGITNYKYANQLSISSRIYKVIWQFYIYSKNGNPNNQSITQRIEYFKTGMHILKNNIILGVGTGDVPDSFEKQYVEDNSKLLPQFRFRAHNQYLTILLTLGVFLGLLAILSVVLPFFMNKKFKELLPTAFFIIVILSMFTDDIFETAVSVNFVSIFYTLLILIKFQKNEQ